MTFRKIAVATALCFGLLVAGEASAQLTGSVTLTNNYLFRGVTQTRDNPALQAGLTWTHDSGFYAGGWGSNISWLSDADPGVSSSVELDGFAGVAGKFGGTGLGYDVGAYYYAYPGDFPVGADSPDTLELYAGVSWKALGAKYWVSTTDLFGVPHSSGSSALDLGANWEFVPGLTLNAGVGKQWVNRHDDLDYAYWKLGLTKAFDHGFSVAAAWNDTDLAGMGNTFTVSLTKTL